MKKVVVISSSFRHGGNSEALAQNFAEGALSSGNEVQFIAINDLNLQYCRGCLYCQSHNKCILRDGMDGLYEKFQKVDVLVFATPIYYYSVSGQLKTFLDRLNPLYGRKNKFKDIYLLTTAADDDKNATSGAINAINGWIECFDGVSLKGNLFAGGVNEVGDIQKTPFLEQAYLMGKNV